MSPFTFIFNYLCTMSIGTVTFVSASEFLFFQAKLLLAEYSQKSSVFGKDSNSNKINFEEAAAVYPFWEDSLVACGEFLSTLPDYTCR